MCRRIYVTDVISDKGATTVTREEGGWKRKYWRRAGTRPVTLGANQSPSVPALVTPPTNQRTSVPAQAAADTIDQ